MNRAEITQFLGECLRTVNLVAWGSTGMVAVPCMRDEVTEFENPTPINTDMSLRLDSETMC